MALASASSSAVSCKHSLLSCYWIGQFLTNLVFFQTKFIMWLKMKRIWRSDRRLNGKDGSIFPARDFPRWSRKKNFSFDLFCHPLLTKLVRSRWPDFAHFRFFFRFFKQTWSTEHISEGTRCLSSAHFRVGCFNVKYISYNCSFYFDRKPENPQLCNLQTRLRRKSGAPNENIVQNHLNIAFLNVF